jgi:YidC/Oxa1 family membrane protein insertase
MERASRWIFLGLAAILAWIYVPKLFGGGRGEDSFQPIGPGKTETAEYAISKTPPQKCAIVGKRFSAHLSTRGAALVDFVLTGDPRYTERGKELELTTVPASAPDRFALHFDWRALGTTGTAAQIAFDVVDWKLVAQDGSSCTFAYQDDRVALTKVLRAGAGPFEIVASATIENKSDVKRVHRLGIENTAWHRNKEVEPGLGRQSPFVTEVACAQQGGKLVRKSPSDFGPKEFSKPEFENGWLMTPDPVEFAATASAYFAQAVAPLSGPSTPACGLQVEERWYRDRYQDKTADPDFGAMYRSRLIYPKKELSPNEKATYEVLAYVGPKDRTVLRTAAGGKHHFSELINLGMFAIISKVLVGFLIWVHALFGNWGIAIIVLTVCVRIVLFPLTWKQIKSMVAMRQLKPEIDEINLKFKDDPQQKQVAMMEVYRKNGVNPFSGCLPILIQMPVWWALYTVLQTAVELYHTPFLWFRDLSAPDPYYLLPVVIGAMSFVQQKIMPQQVDAAQQKMMLYFMPALFTVMMLFLPSGLGVYILTNSVLGILQQQATEHFAPRKTPGGTDGADKSGDTHQSQAGKKRQKQSAGALPAKSKGGS